MTEFNRWQCGDCKAAITADRAGRLVCACGSRIERKGPLFVTKIRTVPATHDRAPAGTSTVRDAYYFTRDLWPMVKAGRYIPPAERDRHRSARHMLGFAKWLLEGYPYEDPRWWYGIVSDLAQDFSYGPEHLISFLLERMPPKVDCALDLGSGTGVFAARMAPRCNQLVALDTDARYLRLNAARFAGSQIRNGTFIQSKAEILPIRNETFDFACAGGVLHLTNPALSIPELFRVLRPGAHIVGYTAGVGGTSAVVDFARNRGSYLFERAELEGMFARAGFSEVWTEQRGTLLLFTASRPA